MGVIGRDRLTEAQGEVRITFRFDGIPHTFVMSDGLEGFTIAGGGRSARGRFEPGRDTAFRILWDGDFPPDELRAAADVVFGLMAEGGEQFFAPRAMGLGDLVRTRPPGKA